MAKRDGHRFEGRVALVTGAASGIGRATVLRLASEGGRVVATDRAAAGLAVLDQELGDAVVTLGHDVVDEPAWKRAVALAEERFGGLHGLVNAAGILAHGTIEDTTLDDWRRMMDVNLYGTFLGCRMAMPALRRGSNGAIVNISSTAGMQGWPDGLAYCASKGGVRSMSKAIALDGAAHDPKVRCNSVHPGVIATPMLANFFAESDDPAGTEAWFHATQPADAFGVAEDVAAMIVYLLSDDASFVTGAEFVIDGAATA